MDTDNTDVNPYESPIVGGAQCAAPAAEGSQPRRRFRWRVIPVAVLYIYGGCGLVGAVVLIGFWTYSSLFDSDSFGRPQPLRLFSRAAPGVVLLLQACVLIFVANALWKGRWWQAGLVFVLGLAACAGLGYLGSTVALF